LKIKKLEILALGSFEYDLPCLIIPFLKRKVFLAGKVKGTFPVEKVELKRMINHFSGENTPSHCRCCRCRCCTLFPLLCCLLQTFLKNPYLENLPR
jgi:hypothetical protein